MVQFERPSLDQGFILKARAPTTGLVPAQIAITKKCTNPVFHYWLKHLNHGMFLRPDFGDPLAFFLVSPKLKGIQLERKLIFWVL